MASILVVNLHGLINVPGGTRRALEELGVTKRFSATVVPDDPSTTGALKHCKDYVAWAPVEADLLVSLLMQRGRLSKRRKLDESSLKNLGFKDHKELASKIIEGGSRLSSVTGLLPFFALSPPRGGFKRSSRRQYGQGGILGANPDLPALIRRMV